MRLRAAALALLLVVGGVACTSEKNPAADAAESFFSAVEARDVARAAAATSDAKSATTVLEQSLVGLGESAKANFDIGTVTEESETAATVAYTVTWTLAPDTTWRYEGTVPVTKLDDGTWQVKWRPANLHPQLAFSEHLEMARIQPDRAALQDAAGAPLFSRQPVVTVGVHPAKATNVKSLAAALASALGLNAAEIEADVKAAPKDQFVPVITLRRPAYDQVRARIYNLPGTVFRESTQLLGPSPTFAQPLLGRVGEATKEIIDASNGTVVAGDETGVSGLQKAFNAQLAGTAGVGVFRVGDEGDRTALAELSAPKAGAPVRLTIDRTVQAAADTALAAIKAPATIVAVQPSTGKVLAVASNPAAIEQGNIAMSGQFPPGSAFKIVTYAAAFTADSSLTPASMVDCPGTMTVNGQTVRNQDEFALGRVSVTTAFARSCNTTAAQFGLKLPRGALKSAAESLGLGASWQLPIEAFAGSLPEPSGPSEQNERAADAYGQGKVLVSPLALAVIAGSAATGKTVAPSLEDGKQAAPAAARPAAVTANLNSLMRAVVTEPGATGVALADVPGNVQGKTGTAEFGTAVPPPSHSWFAGTRGDLAFSAFIYGGEHSTTGAVPLARDFLLRIA